MRVLFVAALTLSAGQLRAEPAQVFVNQGGVKAVVAPYGGDRYVVELSGTRSYLDEHPLLLKLDKSNPRDLQFILELGKETRYVMTQAGAGGDVQVILPESRERPALSYHAKLSAAENGQALIGRYQMQRTSGAADPAGDDAAVKAALDEAKQQCGASFGASIDWTGFPAAYSKDRDVSKLCASALRGIGELCAEPIGKSAVAKSLKAVRCVYAATSAVRFAKGEVTVSLSKDSGDQALRTRVELENGL